MSILFLGIYLGTNWLTLLRHDVPSFYFQWEKQIPLLSWSVVPYMSIDVLFVFAPFLCRDDRQRTVLFERMLSSVMIAACFFIGMPLRFAFGRPSVDGPILSYIFSNFRTVDQPFNQFPSLHISMAMILLPIYQQHFPRLSRFVLYIWFALIAISTLTTYQHHMIDIIGGAVLGFVCLYVFRDNADQQTVNVNPRLGFAYVVGTITLTIFAAILNPIGLILLWPASSMAIMATASFTGTELFYGNRAPLMQLILLPASPLQRKWAM